MNLSIIKMLIESAMADGELSEAERKHIYKKAAEANVTMEEVDILINDVVKKNQQIEKIESSGFITYDIKNNEASGFVTENESVSDNNLSSGFISNNDETKINKAFKQTQESLFTNVSQLAEQGAMSIIFKAKRHDKWIILKRIRPEFRNDLRYIDLFNKEFSNAIHLNHPNIVEVYDKGEDEDGPYYFMEYVDGRPLSALVKEDRPVDYELKRRIIMQICDALSYVHVKQIYHRDLKPDNILLTWKGNNVKIIDFGLAAADYFDDYLVKAGTPKYAAPEQKKNAENVDQRADIYSLGLIFLELLTGSTQKKAISKIKNKVFEAIIEKCLKEDPRDRFSDCRQIYQNLISSKKTEIVPDWQIKKIQEFAQDGSVSDAEWNVLKLQAEQNRIDLDAIKAYVDLEIEKAHQKNIERQQKEKLAEEEAKEKARLKKLKEQQEQLNKQKAEKRLEELKRKVTGEAPVVKEKKEASNKNTKQPKKKKSPWRWFWRLAFIAIIIGVFSYFEPETLMKFYAKYIFTPVKETIENFSDNKQKTAFYMYVTAKPSLNLRSSKTTRTKMNIIMSISYGAPVKVISSDGEWTKIEIEGKTGFVSSEYLSDEKPR